jgi:cell wall-associated NlpC family hydrolase
MIREAIVREAMTWLNTPYHHAARIKGGGVDCGQILIAVYSEVGLIDDYVPDEYPHDWALHRSEERYLHNVLKYAEETDRPQKGDIAVYKFGRCISHAGILIDDENIIHAHLRTKSVSISGIEEGELNGRLNGFYKIKGID